MFCPCYIDDERGMVEISYGFESYHLLILRFGSLPIWVRSQNHTYGVQCSSEAANRFDDGLFTDVFFHILNYGNNHT